MHNLLLSSLLHMRRMKRIKEATDARDQKLRAIAGKLADIQQIMVNHGTQLRALYGGRREEMEKLVLGADGSEPSPAGSSDIAK